MSYTYPYPRPSVTADAMIFRKNKPVTEILLIQRGNPPFIDTWALPGGFMEMDETLETTAKRELLEETGLRVSTLEQFYTFDEVDRDPRGRTISTIFIGFLENTDAETHAGSDAKDAKWFPLSALPPLAFDHEKIIQKAKKKYPQIK